MLGLALHQLGRIQLNAQRFDQAEALLDEAVEFWRTSGISYGHGMSLQSSLLDRGNVKRLAGRHEEAIADFSESIALYASASFTRSGIYPLLFRGHARLALGDVTGALADFRQSLAESKQRQVWSKLISITLAAIGEAAYRLGNWEAAGKLLAAAAAAEDKRRAEEAQATTRERATGGQFSEMADYNRIMAQTPAYQRNPVFAAAWQGGKTLSLGDAVELALTWEESPA